MKALGRKAARVALAAWITLTIAAFSAMAGSWLGWRWAGDLPTDQEMRSITAVALPGEENADLHRVEPISGSEYPESESVASVLVWGTDEYGAGYVQVQPASPVTDASQVAQRLAAAGWQAEVDRYGDVTAARDSWRLTFVPTGSYGPDSAAYLKVVRAEPVPALVLAIVFGLAGAVLGFRLFQWVTRRRSPLDLVGVVGLGLTTLHTLVVLTIFVGSVAARFGTHPYPLLWEPFMTIGFRQITLVGIGLLVVWAALAVSQSRPRPAVSAYTT